MRNALIALRARFRQPTATTFRPSLANGVRLVGPMAESAFARQPWLIERNGRFVQVTELLYRIAELADGTRGVDEIAIDLTNRTGSAIPPEFVWRMLRTHLVPIGIISTVPGMPPTQAGAVGAHTTPRSPLALNMRMAVVSPRLINALTRVLQYLYAPVVLVPLAFVMLQAQYWLLFVHGVSGGLYQALNTPGVVPLVLTLVVLSAAFHELGHAAALRYGGGQVRGMGVGIYLMYPAFYTDVTDNYRLGRWARVRTDLGGFYFNLVFSLGLMALYHVTSQEFLLLVALLTDIEIVHQCLPFVRLDGYWALADLTGIPDFLSFMGAYLRSTLPLPGWKGRKLPELKWWAKVVFALYIATAVPLVVLLLLATLKGAPRLLMTALAAVQQRLGDLAYAEATGDALGAAAAEMQMLLLLLPVFGLCFMLLSLGRTLAFVLWKWGKPTRARRFASGVMAAAVAALVLFLWVPGLGDDTGTVPDARASLPAPRHPSRSVPTRAPTATRTYDTSPVAQSTSVTAKPTSGGTPVPSTSLGNQRNVAPRPSPPATHAPAATVMPAATRSGAAPSRTSAPRPMPSAATPATMSTR